MENKLPDSSLSQDYYYESENADKYLRDEDDAATLADVAQIDKRVKGHKDIILKSTHLALLKRDDYLLYGIEDIFYYLFCCKSTNNSVIHPAASSPKSSSTNSKSLADVESADYNHFAYSDYSSVEEEETSSAPFLFIFRDRECFVVYSLSWFILISQTVVLANITKEVLERCSLRSSHPTALWMAVLLCGLYAANAAVEGMLTALPYEFFALPPDKVFFDPP